MRLTALLSLFLLTSCSGLLPDLVGEPPALYELRPAQTVQVDTPYTNKQLLIDVPVSSAGIDSPRIALRQADGTLAYYKDVSWTDRAPVMLQTLLITTFDRSGKIPAVGRDNVGLRADYLLKTDAVDFVADYTAGAPPMVKVALTGKLIAMPRRIILAGREFNAVVQAETDDMASVQKAFQAASEQVMGDAVRWTLAELAKKKR
jgi:cholesterol transport system auxiliary component